MLHQPKYLILDEPFNGVDFLSCRKIIKELKEWAQQGATILITSHQLELMAETADFLGLIKDGQITENFETAHLFDMVGQRGISVSSFIERELS
jgi:ABC-2 type transport system ATP-binding protein